ncbi:hypothetical protein [Aquimarina mytili]|uniref:Uncharacterized protein n=1 Tax=Aquimarina mytili TaxID=874423 RepID=A0A937A4G5_9FLAO|nr:hypothetical protein [Aquimarina mytili]MBL0684755.1 hypothetical protein [Aquimarina mytili]
MVTFVRFRIADEHILRFVACVKNAIKRVFSSSEEVTCELFQCKFEQENFILSIKCKEGIANKNTISVLMKLFLSQIEEFKTDILEIRDYQEI